MMRIAVVCLLFASATALRAQDSVIVIDPEAPFADAPARTGPPPELVERLVRFYNDSATTRLQGDVSFPVGSRFEGRLGVHRGSVRVGGVIAGPIAVANGTLYLLPGAVVEGDVVVVGGRLIRAETARVDGSVVVVWDAAPVVRTPEGYLAIRERRRPISDLASAQTTFRTGRLRTTLRLATGGTYNRVEGLPIVFGPVLDLRLSDRTATRLDLRGILRTAGSGRNLRSEFGYLGRWDWVFGRTGRFGVGARVFSVVDPIEETLSASETGWYAFLLQRDYRDYYERQGAGLSLTYRPAEPLRVEASATTARERSVRAVDPWSLLRNNERWRPNPLIDDGRYTTLGLGFDFDTRNDRDLPTSGWWVRGRFEHSASDDVAPVTLPPTVRSGVPTSRRYSFNKLYLDARRYSRLTPGTRINTRVRAEGWVTGDPLPIQSRLSLGGPDLLPGYDFRAETCAPPGFNDPTRAGLCDRSIVTQLEVRTRIGIGLGFRVRDRDVGGPDRFVGIDEADLVFFSDAGKGWLTGDGPGRVPNNRIPSIEEWLLDAGVGLDAGQAGIYLAKSLTNGEPVRVFLRLQHRF